MNEQILFGDDVDAAVRTDALVLHVEPLSPKQNGAQLLKGVTVQA